MNNNEEKFFIKDMDENTYYVYLNGYTNGYWCCYRCNDTFTVIDVENMYEKTEKFSDTLHFKDKKCIVKIFDKKEDAINYIQTINIFR